MKNSKQQRWVLRQLLGKKQETDAGAVDAYSTMKKKQIPDVKKKDSFAGHPLAGMKMCWTADNRVGGVLGVECRMEEDADECEKLCRYSVISKED